MTSRTPKPESLPIIFDNTVLSNFALAQSFEVLRRLYEGRAFICRAVLQEIQTGIESGWKYPQLRSRTRLQAVNQAIEEGWLQFPDYEANPGDEVLELRLARKPLALTRCSLLERTGSRSSCYARWTPGRPFSTTNEARVYTGASGWLTVVTMRRSVCQRSRLRLTRK